MTDDTDSSVNLQVHGARGSMSVSGAAFLRHGGNTTCFSIALPGGEYVIIDAGTGLGRLHASRSAAGDTGPFRATLFLTHFHWDHIQGLPVFAPLFDSTTSLHVVAVPPEGMTVHDVLDGAMRPPWWPVPFSDVQAKVTWETLPSGPVTVGQLTVRGVPLRHPGGVIGYRIEHGGRSVVIATDVEGGDDRHDAALRRLADGASVLIHDAQYTPDEYRAGREGWGHSTWEHATSVARDAGVEHLVLTSHEPNRTDAGIDAIVAAARTAFSSVEAAYEGQRIPL